MKEPVLFKDSSHLSASGSAAGVRSLAGQSKFHYEELKSGSHQSDYSFHAEEGSKFEVVFFQNGKPSDEILTRVKLTADQNAKIQFTFIQEGGSKSEIEIKTECLGKGSEIELRGLQNAKLKQKFSFKVHAVHSVPHTKSDLKVWCVARDESQSIFNALVNIEKGAHHTEAYQRNKNLLLSEKATIDTFPKLFIANDDVKCAHGSSTSTLDDDQFYYLQSRGIDLAQAEQMLVKGFLSQALDWISDEPTREKIERALQIREEEFS